MGDATGWCISRNASRAGRMAATALLFSYGVHAAAAPADRADEVTIHRDGMGVPHVFAATAPGVMYGSGYALAHDRLAEFEMFRAVAWGRTAELIGEKGVARDRKARLWAYTPAELMKLFRALEPQYQAMAIAYVAGINRRIDEVKAGPREKWPYEFGAWGLVPTRWTLVDFLQMLVQRPSKHIGQELHNLAFLRDLEAKFGPAQARIIFDDVLPLNDRDALPVIPDGENRSAPRPPIAIDPDLQTRQSVVPTDGIRHAGEIPPATGASRCLVVARSRSATGNVLMMESTADGPDLHLSGGGFEAAGFSPWGLGIPVMGRGRNYGWLLTSSEIDIGTIYAERLDPQDRYRYFYRGEWHRMQRRTETIRVKNGAPVTFEIASTVHGPVVEWSTAGNVAFSQRLSTRGYEFANWTAMVEMARARSFDEFVEKGIKKIPEPFGVCYGDDDGKIAFWETGMIPVRPAGIDPRLPTPGTGEYEWQGMLRYEQRPHMEDPKQGFIHAWNSKPTSDWNYADGPRFGKTFRTWLGTQLAQSKDKISLADLRDFNLAIGHAIGARDRTATSPAFFAPYLRAAVADSGDDRLKQAVALMTGWNALYEDRDGDGFYDDAGLPLFRRWLVVANEMIVGGQIGDWWHKIDDPLYIRYRTDLLLRVLQGSDAATKVRHDFFAATERNQAIRATIAKTIADLEPQFGTPDLARWRLPIFWKYHDPSRKTKDKPALSNEEEARTAASLGLAPAVMPANGKEGWAIVMEISAATRGFVDVTESGGQNLSIGQDGTGNPHLNDQAELHLRNEFKKVEIERPVIAAAAESTIRLRLPSNKEMSAR